MNYYCSVVTSDAGFSRVGDVAPAAPGTISTAEGGCLGAHPHGLFDV